MKTRFPKCPYDRCRLIDDGCKMTVRILCPSSRAFLGICLALMLRSFAYWVLIGESGFIYQRGGEGRRVSLVVAYAAGVSVQDESLARVTLLRGDSQKKLE